ncbi:patatin-like phospholipase family protein [Petrotoga sp. 9PWA.NaAc.5.4]|uniref:patatin-like phospholipase family protein n=1 Tax=Petrotoga sp. 9PWA.NaAc.5.4 TaxID=1434328 RepID=UPI000CCB63F5|nr:patatin-like phospholipase family protein [Petrotoga sp. 9PWA.NaAc.5.4]PNR94151.1 hypothetical protein X924_06945 [Petrotoga sp. 9PWA.NaAc.5.4]
MNLVMGGNFEGFYWESGALEFFAKKTENITLYTTGIGSLRGVFFGLYGQHFFIRLKDFILEKNNPLKEIMKSSELYNSLYAQTAALLKLGRGKMSLYEPNDLKAFLEKYFGDKTLESLPANIYFEVFDIKKNKVFILPKETMIVDMLMMELSFPPYYHFYEYQGGNFIPTSFLSFIPQKFSKNAVIISFDSSLEYPNPKNIVELLLKVSYSRTLKNYKILSEKHQSIIPSKISNSNFYNMALFFDGHNESEKWWEEHV